MTTDLRKPPTAHELVELLEILQDQLFEIRCMADALVKATEGESDAQSL